MQRKVFDLIASAGGAVMVIVLVVAGVLLMWGYSFANSNVHNQLAEQQIVFPAKAAFAHPVAGSEITPSMVGTVSKYAGQPLVTGQQAEVYADDFIAVHLKEIGGGLTYAQLSAERAGSPQGIPRLRRRRGQGNDRVPGHHTAGPAARGLCVRDPRHNRPDCGDLGLRPGRDHGGPGGLRLLARSPDYRRRGTRGAHRSRAGAGHELTQPFQSRIARTPPGLPQCRSGGARSVPGVIVATRPCRFTYAKRPRSRTPGPRSLWIWHPSGAHLTHDINDSSSGAKRHRTGRCRL